MVLVDSSIWFDVDHRVISFEDLLPPDEIIATCPAVAHEVLRGVAGPREHGLARTALMNTEILDSPTPFERFEQAAALYHECRLIGFTLSAMDCLIAACAIAHEIPLLHRDADFHYIAGIAPLRFFSPSST